MKLKADSSVEILQYYHQFNDFITHLIGLSAILSLMSALAYPHASVGTSLTALVDRSSSTRLVNRLNAAAEISLMPQSWR